VNELLGALALLTIVPIRRELHFSARTIIYFPLIGALLGLVLVLAFSLLRSILPAPVTAALLVACWALLTGGLHLDGLSDACDALFAATTRERRLEILRDVHLGSFGAAGLILILLLKFAALTQVNPLAIFLAPVLARWAMVLAACFPLARKEGMANIFSSGMNRRVVTIATIFTFIISVPYGWFAVAAWFTASLVVLVIARLAESRVGGMTGDIYGLVCECVEVSVLIIGTISFRGQGL
jgi:adenosylcobinamide-GDP ribazoletransferase